MLDLPNSLREKLGIDFPINGDGRSIWGTKRLLAKRINSPKNIVMGSNRFTSSASQIKVLKETIELDLPKSL